MHKVLRFFIIAKYVKYFLFLRVCSFYFIDTKCMNFKINFVDIKSIQFFKKEKIFKVYFVVFVVFKKENVLKPPITILLTYACTQFVKSCHVIININSVITIYTKYILNIYRYSKLILIRIMKTKFFMFFLKFSRKVD